MALIVHYTDEDGDHALVTIPDGEPRRRNLVLGLTASREGAIRVAEQLPDVLRFRPRFVYEAGESRS